jgi:hypothetical protein
MPVLHSIESGNWENSPNYFLGKDLTRIKQQSMTEAPVVKQAAAFTSFRSEIESIDIVGILKAKGQDIPCQVHVVMDPAAHNLVRQRAGERCEYCRLPENAIQIPFHVEHVHSEAARWWR